LYTRHLLSINYKLCIAFIGQGSISQPGSPFHSRRFNSQGSGTMRHHGPTSPSGGSIKSPPAVLSPDGTGNRPTAEELYHMLHARPRSSRRHQVGSIRSTTGNCMLAVNRRTTLRRSLSPMPRSAAQSGPHPRSGSSSSPSPPPPLTISLPQADCSIASPMKSPPAQLSAKSTSPKHGLGSFRRSEKSRFSWNFPDWRHTSGSKPLPELIVDEEKGGNQVGEICTSNFILGYGFLHESQDFLNCIMSNCFLIIVYITLGCSLFLTTLLCTVSVQYVKA